MKKVFKLNKDFFYKFVTALIVITVVLLNVKYFFFKNAKVSQINNASYEEGVNVKDTVPLVVPKETLQKGKALTLPILMYHHVGSPPPNSSAVRKGLTVSVSDFEEQVKWVHEQGFTSVSLEDVMLLSQGKFKIPKKPIIFTFDDGYDDVFTNAIPILKKYGFVGSFAIITQYPKTQQGDNIYASWQEIVQAKNDGNEIVCHTQNHFDGTSKKYSADYIFQNLSNCQQDLLEYLGKTEPILVYPYGHYNAKYLDQAKKAGFVMGVTVHAGKTVNLEDLMQLPRVRVGGGETMEKFKKVLE